MSRVTLRMSSESGLLGLFPARCCLATARRLAFSRVVVIFLGTEENSRSCFIRDSKFTLGQRLKPKAYPDPGQDYNDASKRAALSIERAKVLLFGGWVIMTEG